jgi:hypothetical protein
VTRRRDEHSWIARAARAGSHEHETLRLFPFGIALAIAFSIDPKQSGDLLV